MRDRYFSTLLLLIVVALACAGCTNQASPTLPPGVTKAFSEAENAPQQPFLTNWLWLAGIALVMSTIAMLPSDVRGAASTASTRSSNVLIKVTFRFAAIYWCMYCLFSSIPDWYGTPIRPVVEWMANHLLDLTHELVPPNGSGDTTYNYLEILAYFGIAFVGALVWSLFSRRESDYSNMRDLLRSTLRYTLALALMEYGMMKVTLEMNQFPPNGPWQLAKTWGDSSPMNVLWAFMGASRPYTIFSGLFEMLAALLLIWRRTAVLGALVALAVTTNVMLLNYCYDVPVKIYSTHLTTMAVMILLPDGRRLLNLLVLNRTAEPSAKSSVWQGRLLWWAHAAGKTAVLGLLFVLPLGKHIWDVSQQISHPIANSRTDSKYLLTRRGFRWINEVPFNR